MSSTLSGSNVCTHLNTDKRLIIFFITTAVIHKQLTAPNLVLLVFHIYRKSMNTIAKRIFSSVTNARKLHVRFDVDASQLLDYFPINQLMVRT